MRLCMGCFLQISFRFCLVDHGCLVIMWVLMDTIHTSTKGKHYDLLLYPYLTNTNERRNVKKASKWVKHKMREPIARTILYFFLYLVCSNTRQEVTTLQPLRSVMFWMNFGMKPIKVCCPLMIIICLLNVRPLSILIWVVMSTFGFSTS